jgi:hypothetical protein
MANIQTQFEELDRIKVFEIAVIDKRTNENDHILFDISICDEDGELSFVSQHVGLTQEQEDSDKIAFVSTEIDEDLSLDWNLHEHYADCAQAIIDSEFFTLNDSEE